MRKLTPFGHYVRTKRVEKRIRLKEHAEALGICPAYLSGMETGRRDVLKKYINPTADFLNLDKAERDELSKAYRDSINRIVIHRDHPNFFDLLEEEAEK